RLTMPLSVVKVGGSLFNLPDLGPRLARWLASNRLDTILLVPGGGPTADVVRSFDRCQGLGEEVAHWLALRALTLNGHFLCQVLPRCRMVTAPRALPPGGVGVLECHAFALNDEKEAGHLPHSWSATSDSVAARVARVANA